MKSKTHFIVRTAIITSLYVVLTVINPFSYDMVQFRISEILMLLCFYRKDYSISLILGCFVANIFSPLMLYDMIFGTLATVIACMCMMYSKNLFVAGIFPIITNALLVGLELHLLYDTPFIINCLWVALGEAAVMLVGCILFNILQKRKSFMELIKADQNIKDSIS